MKAIYVKTLKFGQEIFTGHFFRLRLILS